MYEEDCRGFRFNPIIFGLLGVIAGAIMVATYHLVYSVCNCYRRQMSGTANTNQNVQHNQLERPSGRSRSISTPWSPPPLPFSSSPQIYSIDQNGTVTIVIINPPPPFPDSPRSVDLSPLEFILALMAVITIPAVIYALFFAVKCPPWTSRERQDSPRELPRDNRGSSVEVIERRRESVSGVKYQKETHSKDIGSECPVCLSVFTDGEEVRQLSGCNASTRFMLLAGLLLL
ncbi:hypothetical protein CRYUN_Cryun05aG0252700 [Craigia yunnanensis]